MNFIRPPADGTSTFSNSHNRYEPSSIEAKWRERWKQAGLYRTPDELPGKPNWYALVMFPYPSGDLHIGHWFQYVGADVHARFKRMTGFNVMHPQGFDAFGLPAENAAIQRNIHPREFTQETIRNMRSQFDLMGTSYDWDRELVSCEPDYYMWNQYFFLKFYEAGLAYRAEGLANWCKSCKTTLANEQVKEGMCERCDTPIRRRALAQWFFRITKYAEELIDTSKMDWPDNIKTMQKNWVGRSEGVEVNFDISEYNLSQETISTFTTRIDTVFGVTFLVLAPEHPLVQQLTRSEQRASVDGYVDAASAQTEMERTSIERDKTGVFTGSYATNPLNGDRVPILVGDYILSTYGTGAVMGVPAHDDRDFAFAKKYGLEIRTVIAPKQWDGKAMDCAYTSTGIQVNSGDFDGLDNATGMKLISDHIEANGWGRRTVTYHLRDWLISRQRYWGTPIPIVYCQSCGTVPVPEADLPILLPRTAQFKPTGRSPLLDDHSFVNTHCPQCGGDAKRETDTMDTFVDSSWYQLRFTSPRETRYPFDRAAADRWMPVHQYMGGVEHAVMHLLYARFFNKALRDLGMVDFDEPYQRLYNQGMMVTEGGKISKRNRPLPADPLVEKFGADSVRCYLMFIGAWGDGGVWSDEGMNGPRRWLSRVWDLALRSPDLLATHEVDETVNDTITRVAHQTSQRVCSDYDRFKFNTAIAGLMEYTNELSRLWENGGASSRTWSDAIERLLLLLAPIAPHFTEELWERTGHDFSIHTHEIPPFDEILAKADLLTIVVQINGKLRATLQMPAGTKELDVLNAALAENAVQSHLQGNSIRKQIFIQDRLINLVVG